MRVCPCTRGYLRNNMAERHRIFVHVACSLWLGPPLNVMYFWFVDDVILHKSLLLITRQRFHVDIRSLYNANSKSSCESNATIGLRLRWPEASEIMCCYLLTSAIDNSTATRLLHYPHSGRGFRNAQPGRTLLVPVY